MDPAVGGCRHGEAFHGCYFGKKITTVVILVSGASWRRSVRMLLLENNQRGEGIVDAYDSVNERVLNLGFETGDKTGWENSPSGGPWWAGSPTWEVKYSTSSAHSGIYLGQWSGYGNEGTGWAWAYTFQPMESLNLRGGNYLHFRAHLRFDQILIDYPVSLCDRAYAAYWIELKKDERSTKRLYYNFMAKGTSPGHSGDWYDFVIQTGCTTNVWYIVSRDLASDFQQAFSISLDSSWRVSLISCEMAIENPKNFYYDGILWRPYLRVWYDDVSLTYDTQLSDCFDAYFLENFDDGNDNIWTRIRMLFIGD